MSSSDETGVRVELIVIAAPPEATIRLDGASLNGNPFRAMVPRSSDTHRIEIAAAGYESKARTIVFDRDRTVRITLEPSPPETKTRPIPQRPHETPTSTLASKPSLRSTRTIDDTDSCAP